MPERLLLDEEGTQIIEESGALPAKDLFAPPTSEEIARRLSVIRSYDEPAIQGLVVSDLDLTGDRDQLYGYAERENLPS